MCPEAPGTFQTTWKSDWGQSVTEKKSQVFLSFSEVSWSNSKSEKWSNSLNFWLWESLKPSVSPPRALRAQCAQNRSILRPLESFLGLLMALVSPAWSLRNMFARGSSHTISSTQTVFIDLSLSVTLANGRIPCPWWRLSRRVSESAENWPLWVEKRFWSKSQNFLMKFA